MDVVDKAFRTGKAVSGPLFTPFIHWIVERCRKLDVDHILYLARDGQLFQKITQKCCDLNGMESHYFYAGSRSSWYRCTPYLLSQRVLEFRIRTEFGSLDKTCNALGVCSADFVEQFGWDPFEPLSQAQTLAVAKYLTSGPGRGKLKELTHANRNIFLQYLRQFGIINGQRIALVDVGWNGNFQTSFESMVQPSGMKLCGFYFGLNHSKPGSDRHWFSYGPSRRPNWLRFYPCLVESLTPADHGSVSTLDVSDGNVHPIFSGPEIADVGIVHAMHAGALDHAEHSQSGAGKFDFKEIVENPPDYLIDVLSEFYFQKPFSPEGKESFVRKHTMGEAVRLSFGFKRKLDDWHWPQANLEESNLGFLKLGLNGRFKLGFMAEWLRNNLKSSSRKLWSLTSALTTGALNRNQYDLVSFDVFDTLLERECGGFQEIFQKVGAEIGNDDFPDLRKMTETRLLRNKNREITIDEIYEELARNDDTLDWTRVKEIELRIEAQNLRPARRANKFLNRIRKTNARIVFISDMYLGADWIKPQLKKHRVWKDGDEIFVSCDMDANKRTGELFEVVREKFPGQSWLHIGDNLVSDIVNPHEQNIYVKWLPSSYFHSFSSHAARFLSKYT